VDDVEMIVDKDDDAQPSWEGQVEAELTWLRDEIARLNRELIKQGGRVNVLMRERDAALAKRQTHERRR
jgi:hypothetical protein